MSCTVKFVLGLKLPQSPLVIKLFSTYIRNPKESTAQMVHKKIESHINNANLLAFFICKVKE